MLSLMMQLGLDGPKDAVHKAGKAKSIRCNCCWPDLTDPAGKVKLLNSEKDD